MISRKILRPKRAQSPKSVISKRSLLNKAKCFRAEVSREIRSLRYAIEPTSLRKPKEKDLGPRDTVKPGLCNTGVLKGIEDARRSLVHLAGTPVISSLLVLVYMLQKRQYSSLAPRYALENAIKPGSKGPMIQYLPR